MDKSDYMAEIHNRLNKIFRASAEGYKVPDIDRHRLEGFMQAGVFLKIVTPAEMTGLLEEVHHSVFGKTMQERKAEKSAGWSDIEVDYGQFDSPTYLR